MPTTRYTFYTDDFATDEHVSHADILGVWMENLRSGDRWVTNADRSLSDLPVVTVVSAVSRDGWTEVVAKNSIGQTCTFHRRGGHMTYIVGKH